MVIFGNIENFNFFDFLKKILAQNKIILKNGFYQINQQLILLKFSERTIKLLQSITEIMNIEYCLHKQTVLYRHKALF